MDGEADELEGWSFLSELGCQKSVETRQPNLASHDIGNGLANLDVANCNLAERLEVAGYAVFDNAAGDAWARGVREEISALVAEGALTPSMNKLASRRDSLTGAVTDGHTLPKTGVYELDVCVNGEVRAPSVLRRCHHIQQLWQHGGPCVAQALSTACPKLRLTAIDTIKLQYSDGSGGCFPMHYDTSSAHSRREVTAILYLNPAWAPGDGGELRLYPFPLDSVDVEPRMDRLAVFNSTEMLHRVMPASAPRMCLCIWFARDEGSPSISLPCRLPRAVANSAGAPQLQFLLQPDNRRLLSKMLYVDAWAQSFKDAFGTGPEVAEALALHQADANTAADNISPELLSLVRECLPIPVPAELANPIINAPALDPVRREHSAVSTAPVDSPELEMDVMGGTLGGVYSERFLRVVKPLYDLHMGVETMAPLLYSLIRFTKPNMVMEVGAGYTTPFMLQALKDNFDEMAELRKLHARGRCTIEGMPWCVEEAVTGPAPFPVLQCVDNLAHENTTAHLVIEAAEKLCTLDHLDLYFKDAYSFLKERRGAQVDLAFLDFGQGDKVGVFVEELWPHVRPGGLVLVHSTLTNSLTRAWLESMRQVANDMTGILGPFATLSLREPHKMFQNSFSIFQKRSGFNEPILTKFP